MEYVRFKARNQQRWFILTGLGPVYLLFLGLTLVPITLGLALSFYKYTGFSAPVFSGFRNYYRLISDPYITTSLLNSVYYTILTVIPSVVLGLLIALGIFNVRRMRASFRAAYFLPTVISVPAAALIFGYLYNPTSLGLVNSILGHVGVPPQTWLGNPTEALPALGFMGVWLGLGYNVILFLAGLQGISKSYFESARIDGATSVQQFWHVTLPMLNRTLVFVLVTSVIGAFQIFTPMQILTSDGGVMNSTLVLVLYIWQTAFQNNFLGYAAAMSVLLLFISLVPTLLILWFMKTEWEY